MKRFEYCDEEEIRVDYDFPPSVEIIAAHTTEPDYSESRWVVYRKNGKLFELEDSHCSCNGWNDEVCPGTEVNKEYLVKQHPGIEEFL